MTDLELTPYNLEKGEVYFMYSDNSIVKWFITNNSENGEAVNAGFCISVNAGMNASSSYAIENAKFYSDKKEHAYTNIKDVKFKTLKSKEKEWFIHCRNRNKFIPFEEVFRSPRKLEKFPTSGVCWNPSEKLREFFLKKFNHYNANKYSKGIAWSSISYWPVEKTSGQPEYTLEELIPFITSNDTKEISNTINSLKEEINPGDTVKVNQPGNPSHGIIGIVDHISDDAFSGKTVFFKEPLPDYPTGGKLSGVPLNTVELVKNNILPLKWCLKVDDSNYTSLNYFLKEHKDEYQFYHESWKVKNAMSYYFHYPQHSPNSYCTARPAKGYKTITTEEFLKHVLTHTDKQQLINESKTQEDGKQQSGQIATACKVSRSNFTIRDTEPIRGIGIKCPKIQIKIGSGYLPD